MPGHATQALAHTQPRCHAMPCDDDAIAIRNTHKWQSFFSSLYIRRSSVDHLVLPKPLSGRQKVARQRQRVARQNRTKKKKDWGKKSIVPGWLRGKGFWACLLASSVVSVVHYTFPLFPCAILVRSPCLGVSQCPCFARFLRQMHCPSALIVDRPSPRRDGSGGSSVDSTTTLLNVVLVLAA
jgi:hypothetical protein